MVLYNYQNKHLNGKQNENYTNWSKKLIDTEEISECFESFLEDATEDNAVYLAQKIIETYLEKNQWQFT